MPSRCIYCVRKDIILFLWLNKIPLYNLPEASQVALLLKNLPANAGDKRDPGSVFGSGRSPGGGNGNPLQNFCLENPTDRGTLRAIVHRVTKNQTQLKLLGRHSGIDNLLFAGVSYRNVIKLPSFILGFNKICNVTFSIH